MQLVLDEATLALPLQGIIDIGAADGTVDRVERSYEPVCLRRGERAQWQALAQHLSRDRRSASAGVEIPEIKPAFRDLDVQAMGGKRWDTSSLIARLERPQR